MRTLTRELSNHIGQQVTLRGWLHKKRLLGGLTFIVVRDRRGLAQILLSDKAEVEKLREHQIGSVLTVDGTVVEDARAPGGVEIHDARVNVEVPVREQPPLEIDKPVSHEPENLDTLFDYRVVALRNQREQAIFRIQAEVVEAVRGYFRTHDFTEIHTPKLLAAATEGGAEVFKIDYFGKHEATLAQSPQFYKQMMVGVFERVYEIAPAYRAEPSATTRHMTEYISIDGEMGFITLADLEEFLGGLLAHLTDHVWQTCAAELTLWNAVKPNLPTKLPVLALEDVHEKYTKATGTKTLGEKDLRPDEERWICEYAKKELGSEAVLVDRWPRATAKFYHKFEDTNQEVAERADLIFRGVEIVTASLREHRHDVLLKQLRAMTGGDPDNPGFAHFLRAMQAGMPPHGGFGMGLERVTQKLLGLHNVKEAALFPRDINRLAP